MSGSRSRTWARGSASTSGSRTSCPNSRHDIGFVLDVGHARLNNNLEEFARNGRPCHVHLHDNGGTNDDHAACGTGTIDFAALLPLLPVSASRIIECSDPAAYEKSVAFLSAIEDPAYLIPDRW